MRSLLLVGLVGLIAQLIDGSLGMAYGVTSSTLLITTGTNVAVSGAVVHLSELGTTLASGASHLKFGNVDTRTVAILAVPGGIGAYLGASTLSSIDAGIAKPLVAVVLLALGAYVLWRFFVLRGAAPMFRGRVAARVLVPLGLVAGALDGFGGGGWGPVGTTSLLSSGRLEPRKVVGSIDTSEFLVALGASIGFLLHLGTAEVEWSYVAVLMAGGVTAAPVAAYIVRHLPPRLLGVGAGGLIILTNLKTIVETTNAGGLVVLGVCAVWGAVWIGLLIAVWRSLRSVESRCGETERVPVATDAG